MPKTPEERASGLKAICMDNLISTNITYQPSLPKLGAALEGMVANLEKSHLRPMQKEGFLCAAKCCDTTPGAAELQQCINNCERKVHVAQNVVNHMIRDFQERVQRCVQRCQDKAQDGLPSQPSERDVEKAQSGLAECAADCAQEYQAQVPKLQKDCVVQLSGIK